MNNPFLDKAVGIVGGQVALSNALRAWHLRQGRVVKISQAHVWNWLNDAKSPMPPAEHCRAIEEATGGQITRYDLRPDVFGEKSEKAAA